MSLILNIETSQETASVCLSEKGNVLELNVNDKPKEHTAWLHPAISSMLKITGHSIEQLEAVAVSIGPGSYTGLRVGLSTAKGFCYALGIPLITVGTLEMIAYAFSNEAIDLIAPAIDARRMEVFTAVYDKSLKEKLSPLALVLDQYSYTDFLKNHEVLFCGNGSAKIKLLISDPNARFNDRSANASHLSALSYKLFIGKQFAELAYTEPLYIKEFHSLS